MIKYKPYIGITGFKTLTQVAQVSRYVDGLPIGYIMFGFTCSDKRLRNPISEGRISPSLQNLPTLLDAVPCHHLPMVHYFTSTPENLANELDALFKYIPSDQSVGVQLNQLWPSPEAILPLLGKCKAITLQVPKDAFVMDDNSIIEALHPYENCVSNILFDPSGGQGQRFDIAENFSLQRCVRLMLCVQQRMPLISTGIAGGLDPTNVAEYIKQIRVASKCSHCDKPQLDMFTIDAQASLRAEKRTPSAYPNDTSVITETEISPDLVEQYIDNALCAFFEETP